MVVTVDKKLSPPAKFKSTVFSTDKKQTRKWLINIPKTVCYVKNTFLKTNKKYFLFYFKNFF